MLHIHTSNRLEHLSLALAEVKSYLDHYQLSNILVEKSLAGIDLEEYKIIAKASGQLPHGKIG